MRETPISDMTSSLAVDPSNSPNRKTKGGRADGFSPSCPRRLSSKLPKTGLFSRVLITGAMVFAAAFASATTYYVKPTGSDSADGKSWLTAFKTPNAALTKAAARDEVWVAQGTYSGTVNLKPKVIIYGGFADGDTFDKRSWLNKKTILTANDKGAVVFASSSCGATTTIDGFFISNGGTDGGIVCDGSPTITNDQIANCKGPGISARNSSPIITGCRVLNNLSTGIIVNSRTSITGCVVSGNKNVNGNGGGIWCNGDGMVISKNSISGNSAKYGGGVYFVVGSPRIEGNNLAGNHADASGGAIYGEGRYETTVLINNNTFDGNDAADGGAVFQENCLLLITGNSFLNNHASGNGGALWAQKYARNDGYISNNLFDNNYSETGEGGACFVRMDQYYGDEVLRFSGNTITRNEAGNSDQGVVTINANADNFFYANNLLAYNVTGAKSVNRQVKNGTNAYFKNTLNGQKLFDQKGITAAPTDIFDKDPKFVDAANLNYRLTATSPLINAGDNTMAQIPTVDRDGNPRISGGKVDIGAYEYVVPTLASFTATPALVGPTLTVTGTVQLINPAPEGGVTVSLSSDAPTVLAVPATISVEKGAKSATFTATVATVKANTSVKVSAKIGAATAIVVPITVKPWLLTFSLTKSSLSAGASTTANLTLNLAAPAAGLPVDLASDNEAATLVDANGNPITSIIVPAGATSIAIPVVTKSVLSATTVKLTASNGGVTLGNNLSVAPGGATLILAPATVEGGGKSVGIVTLPGAFSTDQTVTITSSDPATATSETTVTVPKGKTNVAFAISTTDVATTKSVSFTATYGGVKSSPVVLKVTPNIAGSITFYPGSVKGGESALAVITLKNAPTATSSIEVSSSSPSAKISNSPFPVSAGVSTVFVYIDTVKVTSATTATITATIGGKSFTGTLSILP